MRIGELAALVGVSTRTVRHYHHLGLLPEPTRRANGYRDYRLRDAVTLARIRRLAELGLSLDEIRDVLADDQSRELREVLAELDADLARQQEELGRRRNRLAALLAEADPRPDSTVSPEMAAVLRDLPAGGSLRVRYGAFFDLRIPRHLISSVRRARPFDESGMVTVREGRLAVAVSSQTNVVVELTGEVPVTRPLGGRGMATMVCFFADDPAAAVAALERRRSAPNRRSSRPTGRAPPLPSSRRADGGTSGRLSGRTTRG
jgi:DNA-binding transcriptional MerR regulator